MTTSRPCSHLGESSSSPSLHTFAQKTWDDYHWCPSLLWWWGLDPPPSFLEHPGLWSDGEGKQTTLVRPDFIPHTEKSLEGNQSSKNQHPNGWRRGTHKRPHWELLNRHPVFRSAQYGSSFSTVLDTDHASVLNGWRWRSESTLSFEGSCVSQNCDGLACRRCWTGSCWFPFFSMSSLPFLDIQTSPTKL